MLGRHATDLACNVGERQKVIGNARIGARLLACEDISVPEGVYAAIALMSVKFEGLQGQLFKSLDEALFVGGRCYIRDIAETGRQLRLPEQVALGLLVYFFAESRFTGIEPGNSSEVPKRGERTACRRATARPIGAERVRARKECLPRQAWTKLIGPRKSILPTSTPPLRRTAYVIAMWK
jgi:hypothetical protein